MPTITFSGSGNSSRCYAVIGNMSYYYDGYSTEVTSGTTVTLYVAGRRATNYKRIYINDEAVVNSYGTSTSSYSYTVTKDCEIAFSYSTTSGSNYGSQITVTEAADSGGDDSGGGSASNAHPTLIDGVEYKVKSGNVLVDGISYAVQKGRTLIDGVGYDIKIHSPNGATITITGNGSSLYTYIKIVMPDGTETDYYRPAVITDVPFDAIIGLMADGALIDGKYAAPGIGETVGEYNWDIVLDGANSIITATRTAI